MKSYFVGANQANSIIKTALDFEYSKFNYVILDCEQTDEKLVRNCIIFVLKPLYLYSFK